MQVERVMLELSFITPHGATRLVRESRGSTSTWGCARAIASLAFFFRAGSASAIDTGPGSGKL